MLNLGSLETLLLSALIRGDQYALGLAADIKELTQGKHAIKVSSLYPTLYRMEKKGLVASYWGKDTPEERGGCRRRYYHITPLGDRSLRETQTTFRQLWRE